LCASPKNWIDAGGGSPPATGKLQVKLGRYGKFIGCPNYPECCYFRNMVASERAEPAFLDGTGPDSWGHL
jgi:ssDNA-binding Zn-finger/Zn-ribbon topoisomerase 1